MRPVRENWVITAKRADFNAIAKEYGIDPLIARLIINRDIEPDRIGEYLNGSLSDLHDPGLLADVGKASGLICRAIKEKTPIRVIGDYDIDGVNSTYILTDGLKKLGACVDYAIPDRLEDGYGLSYNLIDKAISDARALIITCDNGISAYSEIEYAKDKGLTVVVTDHHDVPYIMEGQERREVLPPADAVVDPKRSDCAYPYSGICGAVVAMKVLQVVYCDMGREITEPFRYMENAAFATVGDVMELKDENRIIVKYGLEQINSTKNPGLKALIKVCDIRRVSAYHFGFVIGPCINAAGRLDTALKAVELLAADDKRAEELASELSELNARRKDMTMRGEEEAVSMIESAAWTDDKVYIIYLPDIHESIAGIIAGRLRERYERPVFVITGTGDTLKGSGRSISAYSMYDEMSAVRELFTKFGGHPMAAGFSMKRSDIDELRRRLNENETLTDEDLIPRQRIDAAMPLDYISQKLIEELDILEPTGNGNPKPVFAIKDHIFVRADRMGEDGRHLRINVRTTSGNIMKALLFSKADEFLEGYARSYGESALENLLSGRGDKPVKVCYHPVLNEFRGTVSIEIRIDRFQF